MSRAIVGIALAAAIAATPACTGGAPCDAEYGPKMEVDNEWKLEKVRLPDLYMLAGDTAETSLADYFGPAECLESFLEDIPADKFWGVRSSDPAAVAVSVSEASVLATAAVGVADSVLVTVGPTYIVDMDDPRERDYFLLDFYVSVAPR